MDVTITNLKDHACIWEFTSNDRNGTPRVSATPYEVKCRWVQKTTERTSQDGQTLGYPGTVDLDRNVPVFSIIRQGELEDLPATLNNLYKIESIDAVPDLKNRAGKTKYTAVISKHGGRLPTA
jgi:hypothetical protein